MDEDHDELPPIRDWRDAGVAMTACCGSRSTALSSLNGASVFTRAMARESCRRCAAEAERPTRAIRAMLLTGAGRGFCAGQDLSEALPQGDGPMPDISEIVRASYNPIIRAIRTLEKPVVCAVNGVAAGAGANLAFACDLTIAADMRASWRASPSSAHSRHQRHLLRAAPHRAPARHGDVLPRREDAGARAKEWGLIWDVVPAADCCETCDALARSSSRRRPRGASGSPSARRVGGNTLDAQLDVEAQCMQEAGRTADYAEGVRAFLEKRAPIYTGR
jgi:2-(1,2-epoxy-1,2-dihydrophenyl)acetyl-CoA isomerase